MAATDLCSLAQAKSWLEVTDSSQDTFISGLITSASRTIYAYINRSFLLPGVTTEVRDGTNGQRLLLSEWPVQSIISLTIGGTAIAANADTTQSSGYIIDAADLMPPCKMQRLTLFGRSIGKGISNVVIVYNAGYQVTGEVWTVPTTPYQVTTTNPYGDWGSDVGVKYVSTGVALVAVSGAPAVGQYSVASGVYTFNSADAAKQVSISYGYIPADIKQACIEAVGERFRYRNRIGINSKTLASQETISYTVKDLPTAIKQMLQSYVANVPL